MVRGLLTAVPSPVAEHRLQGTWAPAAAAHGLMDHGLQGAGSVVVVSGLGCSAARGIFSS